MPVHVLLCALDHSKGSRQTGNNGDYVHEKKQSFEVSTWSQKIMLLKFILVNTSFLSVNSYHCFNGATKKNIVANMGTYLTSSFVEGQSYRCICNVTHINDNWTVVVKSTKVNYIDRKIQLDARCLY